MATREATCPYCKRAVGLINERPMRDSRPRGPRLIRHAAEDRPTTNRGRRPLCVKGSGLPVDEADVREASHSPSRRYREALAR